MIKAKMLLCSLPMHEHVPEIIQRFGSQAQLAAALGIQQTTVSNWTRAGIPRPRQEQLLELARREGVELSPADFFPEAA